MCLLRRIVILIRKKIDAIQKYIDKILFLSIEDVEKMIEIYDKADK